jgi:multidrug resistance efflux pump
MDSTIFEQLPNNDSLYDSIHLAAIDRDRAKVRLNEAHDEVASAEKRLAEAKQKVSQAKSSIEGAEKKIKDFINKIK